MVGKPIGKMGKYCKKISMDPLPQKSCTASPCNFKQGCGATECITQ